MTRVNAANAGQGLLRALVTILAAFALIACGLHFGSQLALAAPDESSSTAASESTSAESSSTATDADVAAEDEDATDTDTPVNANTDSLEIGGDVFIASDSLVSSTLSPAANLFLAGQSLSVNKGSVGADAFVAGADISLTGTTIDNNLFAAGNNLTVSGISAANLFLAGKNLDVDAEAENAFIAGDTVFLKGTFTGDVKVEAASVVVDPYLVVDGTLDITAQQEPTIASTAKIANYNFNVQESSSGNTFTLSFSDIGSQEWLWSLLMVFIGMLVVCLFILLALRTEVVDATGSLLKERPLAIFVTGLLSLILIPAVAALLCLTIVAIPISVFFFALIVVVAAFASVYTAIMIGRAVLPRVNKWVTSILFVIVFALLLSIPIVAIILSILCIIFSAGSLVQGWWVWRRNKKDDQPAFDDGGFGDFSVPRGTHANPQATFVPETTEPTPAAPTPSDYAPRNWNE